MPKAPKKPADTENEDEDEGQEEGPKYVTVEQLNAAIAGKLKAFETKLPKLLEAPLASFSAQLQETLAAVNKKPEENNSAESATITQLRKQNDAIQQQLRAAEDERKAEAAKADRREQLGLLDTVLASKVKLENPTVRAAVSKLLEDRVARSEDGRIVFRTPNKFGGQDETDVEAGVLAWAKTDDGKAFLPPRKAAGSGFAPSGPAPKSDPKKGQDPKVAEAERTSQAKRELAAAFLGVPLDSAE